MDGILGPLVPGQQAARLGVNAIAVQADESPLLAGRPVLSSARETQTADAAAGDKNGTFIHVVFRVSAYSLGWPEEA
jgi:hypothetical protein